MNLKPLLFFALIATAAVTTSCDTKYSGTVNIKGYLLDSCNGNQPLANYNVSFERYILRPASAVTDENGFFHLQGDYAFKTRKVVEAGTIEFYDTKPNNSSSSRFTLIAWDEQMNLDTIYGFHYVNSVLTIQVEQNSTTIQDTLFLWARHASYSNTPLTVYHKNGYPYHYKYAGPFTNNQIIDTIKTKVDAHTGYGSWQSSSCSYFLNQSQTYFGEQRGLYPYTIRDENASCNDYPTILIDINQ